MPRGTRFRIWILCVLGFAYLPVWGGLIAYFATASAHYLREIILNGDAMLISSAVMADGFGRTLLRIQEDRKDGIPPTEKAISMLICSFASIVGCMMVYAFTRGETPQLIPMLILESCLIVLTTVFSATIVLVVEA